MFIHPQSRQGVTFPELVVVLVIIGIVTVLAAPAAWRWTAVARVRSSLDQISTELYRARMLAVESGDPVSVILRSDEGCIRAARTHARGSQSDSTVSVGQFFDVHKVCLQHTGDSILTFNARGMLKPPTRSIYSRDNLSADSLLISIAGRLRRNY